MSGGGWTDAVEEEPAWLREAARALQELLAGESAAVGGGVDEGEQGLGISHRCVCSIAVETESEGDREVGTGPEMRVRSRRVGSEGRRLAVEFEREVAARATLQEEGRLYVAMQPQVGGLEVVAAVVSAVQLQAAARRMLAAKARVRRERLMLAEMWRAEVDEERRRASAWRAQFARGLAQARRCARAAALRQGWASLQAAVATAAQERRRYFCVELVSARLAARKLLRRGRLCCGWRAWRRVLAVHVSVPRARAEEAVVRATTAATAGEERANRREAAQGVAGAARRARGGGGSSGGGGSHTVDSVRNRAAGEAAAGGGRGGAAATGGDRGVYAGGGHGRVREGGAHGDLR